MKTAIFPGTFDPFTLGHADIVERGLKIFDRIVIAIGINEGKTPYQSASERLDTIQKLYEGNPNVDVCTYSGLTSDFAQQQGACAILRGVRSIKDFEYERDIADVNNRISNIETVVLFSAPHLSAISSSVVRELHHFGKDVSEFLPKP